MQIQTVGIESVVPYAQNPRVNDAAVDAVARSIKEFGFRQPIVVDADNVIVVGHTRWKAAKSLGLTQIPVHVAKDLTPEQAKAYRLADNQTATIAEWDKDLLPLELIELKDLGVDLSLLGWSPEDLNALLAPPGNEGLVDPDSIPAPPDEATTKPGDLWVLGQHRLLCGDSSKPDDLDRLLGGQVIHLVNTDPPYNVKVEPRSNNAIAAGLSSFAPSTPAPMGVGVSPSGTHHQKFDVQRHPEKSKGTHKKLRAKDRPLANDFVSDDEFDRLLDAWFGNIARVLIPGGGFYCWGGYANVSNYPPVFKKHELYFSQAIIWDKMHPVLTRKDFMGAHEWCFYGWKEGAAHRFFGPVRQETFSIDDFGALVRSVVPIRGEPYQHRCTAEAFQEIAHAIDESKEPFVLEDLRLATSVTWTQIAVAVAFLKERGVIVPASGRNHKAASKAPYEDAMVEFTALKDQTA